MSERCYEAPTAPSGRKGRTRGDCQRWPEQKLQGLLKADCKSEVEAGLSTKDLRGCVEASRPLTTLEAAVWLPSITNGQRCWSLHILRQQSGASSDHLSQTCAASTHNLTLKKPSDQSTLHPNLQPSSALPHWENHQNHQLEMLKPAMRKVSECENEGWLME